MLPHLRFATQSIEENDRLDALNTFSRGLYTYSRSEDNKTPHLALDAWALDDVAAASFSYGPTKLQTPQSIDADFRDMMFLRWIKSGHLRVESDDARREFSPGSMFLMNARHKLHALDDGYALSLRLPIGRVGYDPLSQDPIVALNDHSWQVKVLKYALTSLFETLSDTASPDAPGIAKQLSELVQAAAPRGKNEEDGVASLKSNRALAMRRFLLTNLARSDLSVSTLQREFNASRATVYRAFDEIGGVANFVREHRLSAIHRDLRSTEPARGAIRRIAEQHGLYDQTTFLRMFRSQYGMRPSDVLGSAVQENCAKCGLKHEIETNLPSLAAFWRPKS
ncbi:AraC family transcriptional regulator [uncultured Roseibium sp.]|uniref:helix-turn-helix transcriptional regulator n=1 Tax=uncultured Roseibium sp. TaxID=1936171 RepID=UPI00261B5AF1|nr:AraC family transcriptional regulator [uncultured Roseibium sp.]